MYFLICFAIACVSTFYFYRIITNNDNDWSVIPKGFRLLTIPFYVFTIYYITGLLFIIDFFIPSIAEVVGNWILGAMALFSEGWTFAYDAWIFVWNIVSGILAIPIIFFSIMYCGVLPDFKGETQFTFLYRCISLVLLIVTMLFAFVWDMRKDTIMVNIVIFFITICASAVYTFRRIIQANRDMAA